MLTRTPVSFNEDTLSIGIIGGGPMAVYLVSALLDLPGQYALTVFENDKTIGYGTPYDPEKNPPHMLANIASIELPPVRETLCQWLCGRPISQLENWGIANTAMDQRAFFPRSVLGEYFAAQFEALCQVAGKAGIPLKPRTQVQVIDVIARQSGVVVRSQDRDGTPHTDVFDHVVVATGYGSHRQQADGADASQPSEHARRIAVLGTSLTAIDKVVAWASAHGRFRRDKNVLIYHPTANFTISMLSRKGILPEADFWFPHPTEPIEAFTDEIFVSLTSGMDGDLDRVFDIFRRELTKADPGYAAEIGLAKATADTFVDHYFHQRLAKAPFEWATCHLAEARYSYQSQQASPWRHALLRMHEVFGRNLSRLSAADQARFDHGMKSCFIDNYAAVPHLSMERLLALHNSGNLTVSRLGDTYSIEPMDDRTAWQITTQAGSVEYDAILDARGKRPLEIDDFVFPTLRLQLCAQAVAEADIVSDSDRTQSTDPALQRIHMLSIPLLLRNNPFIQGLVECHDMARATARKIASLAIMPADKGNGALQGLIDDLERTRTIFLGDHAISLPGTNLAHEAPRPA